jgi:hypothetical protein
MIEFTSWHFPYTAVRLNIDLVFAVNKYSVYADWRKTNINIKMFGMETCLKYLIKNAQKTCRMFCQLHFFYISMKSRNIYEIIISIERIGQIPYNHDRYNLYNISFLLISILLYVRG